MRNIRHFAVPLSAIDDARDNSQVATTKPPSEVSKFIETPELLENILLFLQQYGLLVAQKVSAQFSNTMNHSRKVQHALVLDPHAASENGLWIWSEAEFDSQTNVPRNLLLDDSSLRHILPREW